MFLRMTHLTRFSAAAASAACLAAFAVPLAAQSSRGMGYGSSITIDSGGVKHTMTTRLETLGGKVLVGVKSDASGGPALEMVTIVDTVAGTITNVIPAQSMAMILPRSMGKMNAPAYSMELGPNPTVELVDLGAGDAMLGHATRHARMTVAYTTKITVGGETCTRPTREVADIWTATDVQMPDLMGALKSFMGSAAMPGAATVLDSLRNKTVKGTILRRSSSAAIAVGPGDTLRVGTSVEMTSLSPNAIDPRDFDVPSGYRVMDMRAMIGNMDPAAMQEALFQAQLGAADKLKGILCGSNSTRSP